ncbi:MAG: peptide chain release factor N(5)-glutamine methyltransferase [Actinobacteria bacterium]|nr:MAG: peptide chain release factor N(5)-glutamine methyltransferase [Actinomycetota bacterium]
MEQTRLVDSMVDDLEDRAVAWRQLWNETAELIGDRTHALWLCEVASSSASGEEFMASLDEAATVRMVAHLDAMLARYRAGEPLQYVLGQWGFRHIELAIDSRVLIPRPETELVAEVALEKAAAIGPTRLVADLGTGSGAIGLSMAHELPRDGTTVWITDASADALDVARANIAGLGPAGRNVRAALGSWLDALPTGESFDVIVANPPYVSVDSTDLEQIVGAWEPPGALFAGSDGLDDIRTIVSEAINRLREGGWLILEIGADHGAPVIKLMGAAGYIDVEVRRDLAGLDRIAVGRSPIVASPD